MKQKLITKNMVSILCGNSLQQWVQLYKDSIILFKNKSYTSSCALWVLSMEELGKCLFWDRAYFYWFTDQNYLEFNKDFANQIRKMYSDHITKQEAYISYAHGDQIIYEKLLNNWSTQDQFGKLLNDIQNKIIQYKKNQSLYSDIKRSDESDTYFYGWSKPSDSISINNTISILSLINWYFEEIIDNSFYKELKIHNPKVLSLYFLKQIKKDKEILSQR